jgi:hypothetical protein
VEQEEGAVVGQRRDIKVSAKTNEHATITGHRNIAHLNLAAVKSTTVQKTKLPLWYKLNMICMICLAKTVLTEIL